MTDKVCTTARLLAATPFEILGQATPSMTANVQCCKMLYLMPKLTYNRGICIKPLCARCYIHLALLTSLTMIQAPFMASEGRRGQSLEIHIPAIQSLYEPFVQVYPESDQMTRLKRAGDPRMGKGTALSNGAKTSEGDADPTSITP